MPTYGPTQAGSVVAFESVTTWGSQSFQATAGSWSAADTYTDDDSFTAPSTSVDPTVDPDGYVRNWGYGPSVLTGGNLGFEYFRYRQSLVVWPWDFGPYDVTTAYSPPVGDALGYRFKGIEELAVAFVSDARISLEVYFQATSTREAYVQNGMAQSFGYFWASNTNQRGIAFRQVPAGTYWRAPYTKGVDLPTPDGTVGPYDPSLQLHPPDVGQFYWEYNAGSADAAVSVVLEHAIDIAELTAAPPADSPAKQTWFLWLWPISQQATTPTGPGGPGILGSDYVDARIKSGFRKFLWNINTPQWRNVYAVAPEAPLVTFVQPGSPFTASWTVPAHEETITGYEIEATATGSLGWTGYGIFGTINPPDVLSFSWGPLPDGYADSTTIRVRALDAYGYGAWGEATALLTTIPPGNLLGLQDDTRAEFGRFAT